jgi:DNA repair exonuclease SbcCD ATPase subunit
MNSLRTVREAKINFIFFQDIITCVLGILILVTLMLSLSLDTGEAATAEEEQFQTQLRQAKENLAQLEQQNRSTEEKRLLLASLPDRSTLETELALLKRQATNTAEQLRRQQESAANAKTQIDRAALERQNATNLEKEITALKNQLATFRDELAEARRRTNSVYIVPAPDAQQSAREPVAFIVSANKIEIKRLNAALSETHDLSSGAEDLRPLLALLNPEREYVVFYFRPSGAKWFEPFRNLARSLGFAVGYDAIEEQKEVIFSTK